MHYTVSMRKLLFMLAIGYSTFAQAGDTGLCDRIDIVKKNAQQQLERYSLMQFGFDDEGKTVSDLAIIVYNVNLPAQIRRVTFARGVSAGCYFKPIALEAGGDWGWHVLWAEPQGLLYARMDGEAWVSSNPKYLARLAPINPQFRLNGQMLTVTWQQTENGITVSMQAISSDEGRSWDIMPVDKARP